MSILRVPTEEDTTLLIKEFYGACSIVNNAIVPNQLLLEVNGTNYSITTLLSYTLSTGMLLVSVPPIIILKGSDKVKLICACNTLQNSNEVTVLHKDFTKYYRKSKKSDIIVKQLNLESCCDCFDITQL